MRYRRLGNGCLGGCLRQYLSHWYRVPQLRRATLFFSASELTLQRALQQTGSPPHHACRNASTARRRSGSRLCEATTNWHFAIGREPLKDATENPPCCRASDLVHNIAAYLSFIQIL